MLSQKQAVTNAVLSIYKDYQLGGETILSDILTKENKDKVTAMVFEGFKAGKVSLSDASQKKYEGDDQALLEYTGGMVDNWVRKNPDFNAGQKYKIKNPGSRAGSQDETIKALRAILKQPGLDQESIDEVNQAIADRLAEIKPETKVEINVDALPEHLRHLAE